MKSPAHPHPISPARPRPMPTPRPAPKPPSPRPSRVPDRTLLLLAAALILVGTTGLTVHYWPTLLLLVALPTKQWRAAAMNTRPVPLRRAPAVTVPPDVGPQWSRTERGRSGSSSRNASPGGALAG